MKISSKETKFGDTFGSTHKKPIIRIIIKFKKVYLHAVYQLLRKEKVEAHLFSSFVQQNSEKKLGLKT